MASKMVSLRLDEELLDWATAYADERGVSRTELLENAVVSFRRDCENGVPQFRERVKRQTAAPKAEATREDFNRATMDRVELFATLRTPDSVRGLKPKNA